MRRAAIFLLSDVRSGSTLLAQCLGSHPEIVSLGEVQWLSAYVSQDRSVYDPARPLVCACGAPFSQCEFWMQVESSLGRPLASILARRSVGGRRRRHSLPSKIAGLPGRLVRNRPSLYRYRAIQRILGDVSVAREGVELFDAVSRATSRPYCLNSSKSPFFFRAVHDLQPRKTLAIVLVRDYRAVVDSKMRRGLTIEDAATGWRQKMLQIAALTGDLPPDHRLLVKYEEFCQNPREELERMSRFVGIEFTEAMLHRASADQHDIGGSPSKFDPSRAEITYDSSFENRFRPEALAQLRCLVGDVAEQWGY